MKKANVGLLAAVRLGLDAVQFDQNVSYQDQDAWPFWYPLIPYPFEETDQLNGGLGLIGFEFEPNEVKDISVITARDTAFRHMNTRFILNQCTIEANLTGTVTVTAGSTAVVGVATAFDTELNEGQRWAYVDSSGLIRCGIIDTITNALNMVLKDAPKYGGAGVNHGNVSWVWWTASDGPNPSPQIPITFTSVISPLTRKVDVKLNIPSLKSTDFYGNNLYQSASGLTERRLPVNVLQGWKDGNPMLRSPDALVPPEGTITYQFANNHTQPIFVNAVAYGYKISLDTDSGV